MAGETLSGTYKTGITLTSSLATLTGAAVINAPSSAIGIYIPASLGTFTLFTSGHVTAGPAPPPNSLASYTQGDGIVADASGYIANAGTIRGIANAAAIGITMAGAAASVSNLSGAVIYGYTDGISIESNNANSATVSNAGLISAGHGANDAGVRIVTGGGALDLTNLPKGRSAVAKPASSCLRTRRPCSASRMPARSRPRSTSPPSLMRQAALSSTIRASSPAAAAASSSALPAPSRSPMPVISRVSAADISTAPPPSPMGWCSTAMASRSPTARAPASMGSNTGCSPA